MTKLIKYFHSKGSPNGSPNSSPTSPSSSSSSSSSSLDGLFLIRKCSASPDDFSLSLIFKGQFYHYRVSHSIDAYYVLDDGPLIHGLDELVRHYQFDPHGLPGRLSTRFVPSGMCLPSTARVLGHTNPLHLASSSLCKRLLSNFNFRLQISINSFVYIK